jgi:hypothetical protein
MRSTNSNHPTTRTHRAASTTHRIATPRTTSITVIEPIREKLEPPQKTKRSKALQALGDGIGFVCYMLCLCCVLGGEQQRRPKQHYDDDELGTRVRKVSSTGTVGSNARSGRVRMAR